jgi:outer membrane protein assembly factor BamB
MSAELACGRRGGQLYNRANQQEPTGMTRLHSRKRTWTALTHGSALTLAPVLALAFVACGKSGAGGSGAGGSAAAGGTTGTDASVGAGGTTGTGGAVAAGDSVLMHHKNLNRDGLYVQPALTKAAAAGLHKDTTFVSPPLQGQVFAQPLFVDGGAAGQDLIIVATENNNVYGLNGKTGAQVWMKTLGAPVPLASMPCGNIDPYGVTGTPVIDLASRTLYVGAMTTPDAGTTKRHLVFAMSIDDGSMKAGWPVDVAAKAGSGGTAFTAAPQSQRGALAILGDRLYVPYGGLYGDCGNYHGWVVAIALGDPTQVQAWATTARAGGIWAPSGVVSDGQSIYVTTGNTQGATMNMWGGGEGLVRFAPGASFPTPAYWAPTNWLALDNADLDLGGTGPVVVDLAGSTPSRVAVALGKDGNGYLIDRDNLAGVGAPLSMIHAATSQIITAAALYKTASATYVAFRAPGASCTNAAGDLTTLKLMPGTPPRLVASWCATQGGSGAPIVTTTDGQSDAIVWGLGAEGDGHLHGFDGDTGSQIFSGAATTIAGLHRFNSPIAAKGRIFVAADGGVVAFTP